MIKTLRKHWSIALTVALFGTAALAGTLVDQGAPGKYGPWPVRTTGGGSSDAGSGGSSVNVYLPAAQTTALAANGTACTAVGGASCTVIWTASEFAAWTNVTIALTNTDGADAITNVLVEWSPNGSNWEIWDSTTFAALAAGVTKSIAISGNSRLWLRIEARAVGNVTNAVVTITANDG